MEDFFTHFAREEKKQSCSYRMYYQYLKPLKMLPVTHMYVHCTRGTHLTFWHFGLLKILDLAKIWSIKITVHIYMHDAETQNI